VVTVAFQALASSSPTDAAENAAETMAGLASCALGKHQEGPAARGARAASIGLRAGGRGQPDR